MTSTAPILAPELAKAVAAQRDRLDLEVLSRAYRMSAQAHQGQKRLSGDDFVSHSVAVATILAEQQMDTTTIAAALLHDVVEDTDTDIEDVRAGQLLGCHARRIMAIDVHRHGTKLHAPAGAE